MTEILRNCGDCDAKPGEQHIPGCDVERCSVCSGQWINCGHKRRDPAFARWTGLFPGAAEAAYLGIGLNEFQRASGAGVHCHYILTAAIRANYCPCR